MDIKEYFNKNWESVELSIEKKEQIEVILFFINKYIKNNDINYFEFGCGNCFVTNILFDNLKNNYKKINFTVSDISEIGLAYCNKKYNQELIVEEKQDFKVKDKSMDIVTSFEVFEHLDDNKQDFYLNQLLKITKKYLIIGLPYNEMLEKRIVNCKFCDYTGHIWGHLRSYSKKDFENLFEGKAKLIEYKLCGSEEVDFNKNRYDFVNRIGYKNLNFICPSCTEENNEITLLNRIYNKIISQTLLNTKLSKTVIHPFWIVGIFEKLDNE